MKKINKHGYYEIVKEYGENMKLDDTWKAFNTERQKYSQHVKESKIVNPVGENYL